MDDWNELDALARSTIVLNSVEIVYFTVIIEKTTNALWKKLRVKHGKETSSNKVCLTRKIIELWMGESGCMASNLNEFNVLFSWLHAQKLKFDTQIHATFLMCSLPSSWDTFHMVISNSISNGVLNFEDVVGSFLT